MAYAGPDEAYDDAATMARHGRVVGPAFCMRVRRGGSVGRSSLHTCMFGHLVMFVSVRFWDGRVVDVQR